MKKQFSWFVVVCSLLLAQGVNSAVILSPTADALIWGGTQANANFSGNDVGTVGTVFNSDPMRVLMNYDLSGLAAGNILSAKLRLTATSTTGGVFGPATFDVAVYNLLGPFSESTVTWNTAPSASGTASTITTITNGNSAVYEFDITGLAKSWANGSVANYGMLIRAVNDGPGYAGLATRVLLTESGFPPQLMVETIPEPSILALLALGGLALGVRLRK